MVPDELILGLPEEIKLWNDSGSIVNECCSIGVQRLGKSKGAVAITNYNEVIATKIKTHRNNFRSGGFDPWRSSNFNPCRSSGVDRSSSGVKLQSGGDRSVRRQSEEGRRVERIMKGIEGNGVSEFCDTEDCTKTNEQEALILDQELEININNLMSDRN